MTFLTYRSNRQSIREKEIEYAKKGKDTTIDSLNEAKEILSELNEEIKGSFRESGEYINCLLYTSDAADDLMIV